MGSQERRARQAQFPLVAVFSLPEKDLVQDSADIIEKERDSEFKLRLVFVLILLGYFMCMSICACIYVHHMCA